MPKISVILCAYNAEEFLADAVNSVLGQTFEDFELIIVNDGSRDSTPAVASQFCQTDKRVRLVNIATRETLVSMRRRGTLLFFAMPMTPLIEKLWTLCTMRFAVMPPTLLSVVIITTP